MSLSEQIQRVDGSQNDILKKVLGAFGVTVGENKIDQLAALAKAAPLLKENSLYSPETAALFGLGADSVPDDVLALLSKAALYKTITPTAQLGTLPEGSIIYLNENGSPVPFYVAKQGYEPSYNTNRVLVVRKDSVQNGLWSSSNVNTYDGSTIDTWFNQTYLPTLDSDVQTAIGTTNIPYTPMGGTTTVQRISKAVFALSLTEMGFSLSDVNTEGTALPIANILQVPLSAYALLSRSPVTSTSNRIAGVVFSGASSNVIVDATTGDYRPAFTLPTTFTAYTDAPTTGLYDVSDNLLLKLPGVQIETGSYVGTGTYGESNPNSLTFGFGPKLIWVYGQYSSSEAQGQTTGLFLSPESIGSGRRLAFTKPGTSLLVTVKYSGANVLSWYGSTADAQLNYSGYTYYYIALG